MEKNARTRDPLVSHIRGEGSQLQSVVAKVQQPTDPCDRAANDKYL